MNEEVRKGELEGEEMANPQNLQEPLGVPKERPSICGCRIREQQNARISRKHYRHRATQVATL
jgi:hypothetical protein